MRPSLVERAIAKGYGEPGNVRPRERLALKKPTLRSIGPEAKVIDIAPFLLARAV